MSYRLLFYIKFMDVTSNHLFKKHLMKFCHLFATCVSREPKENSRDVFTTFYHIPPFWEYSEQMLAELNLGVAI